MASTFETIMYFLGFPTALWIVSYFIPLILVSLRPVPNLKKRYNAEWALVTGGSSGIGRALVDKLALQGLNIVIVACPDKLLEDTHAQLVKQFPNQEFRKVGAFFAPDVDYMAEIEKETKDINVQLVFNNAGYIVTSFYHLSTMKKQMDNLECNLTAPCKITLHFLQKMLALKLKGCFVYTSSVSGYIPNPFAVMYGTTKSGLSQFASSLAVEVMTKGIDVLVWHPSPVASNFYNNLAKIDSLEMFKKAAVSADSLPNTVFKSLGWFVVRDVGTIALCIRSVISCASYNFFSVMFAVGAPFMDDYKRNDK